jgi:hypothetical protein
MSIKASWLTGRPTCEHIEHRSATHAVQLNPIRNGTGVIDRWVAVCEYHADYGRDFDQDNSLLNIHMTPIKLEGTHGE